MIFEKIHYLKISVPILVVAFAIVFRYDLMERYHGYVDNIDSPTGDEGIFTEAALKKYNGVLNKSLYLAVLGIIFDVTKGRKHYEKGAGYHYFVGKDGTRALVTGKFNDESKEKDHVMDLSCKEIMTLLHWKDTFFSKYEKKGVLVGRYYDEYGQITAYSEEFENKVEDCQTQQILSRQEDQKYPPCNIAWNADEGTKVWCTKSSGGITRYWVGVPRQLYTPGVDTPRCVCIRLDDPELPLHLLKEYHHCPQESSTCAVETKS